MGRPVRRVLRVQILRPIVTRGRVMYHLVSCGLDPWERLPGIGLRGHFCGFCADWKRNHRPDLGVLSRDLSHPVSHPVSHQMSHASPEIPARSAGAPRASQHPASPHADASLGRDRAHASLRRHGHDDHLRRRWDSGTVGHSHPEGDRSLPVECSGVGVAEIATPLGGVLQVGGQGKGNPAGPQHRVCGVWSRRGPVLTFPTRRGCEHRAVWVRVR